MRFNSWFPATAAVAFAAAGAGQLGAQVTSGSVGGTVTDEAGAPVGSAQVQVTNVATGFRAGALTREDGRYTVSGLDVGSEYTVTVRRIGFAPVTREGVRVSLGQTARVDVPIARQAAELSAVTVTATTTDAVITSDRTGVQTTISDSTLRRLPTLGRNFTDFVQLTPQISNAGPGLSGGGVNNRFNSIQIDGAFASDAFGLGSTGQPGGQAGGRSISILAVKEYQVLLSPFDVRQGTFSGALINAVTQNGTNQFRGALEAYGRNQSLTREQPYLNDFRQNQYAGSLGGPIVRDKAFFFVNADVQQQRQPASGPFLGSQDQTTPTDSISRFANILQNQYGIAAGGAEQVTNQNPLVNIFGRLDFNLGAGNRLALRHNYAAADNDVFSRSQNTGTRPNFALSSYQYFFRSRTNQSVAQLYSSFANGVNNELIVGYSTIRDSRTAPIRAPAINVITARRDTVTGSALVSGSSQLQAGTENSSQSNSLNQDFIDVTDNLNFSLGAHRLTVGTQNRFFKFNNVFGQNSFGNWTFNSLALLEQGAAASYQVGVPAAINNGAARFDAATYSAYLQDEWQSTPRVTVTAGLRAEIPTFGDTPPYNRSVDSLYSVRTDVAPDGQVQLSPRLGFNWDVTGDARNQLRGGVGVFVGNPAYVWLGNAFQNSGLTGYASLTCNGNTSATSAVAFGVPAFNQGSVNEPPTQCASITRNGAVVPGATAALGGAINVIDPDFKFPQQFKGSLGFDRRLGRNYIATLEGLYTRTVQDVFYTNLALPTPVGTDARGRVLYGTYNANGAVPAYRPGGRQSILNIENTTKGYGYNLTGGLQRQFANRYSASVFYTYSQVRDVASTSNSTANSNFALGRSVADTITKQTLGRSRFEQPHRIVATTSYSFPSNTDVSLIYTGQSGNVFDFGYGGSGGFGDLNADGQRNDLLYVPRTAFDLTEIRFTGNAQAQQEQAAALENFIQNTPCLANQRGRIMSRNSCRTPWQNNLNVRLEQSLPQFAGQRLTLRGEVFNFLNLLNRDWGELNTVNTGGGSTSFLLSETGKVTATGAPLAAGTSASNAQGLYQFDTNQQLFNANNVASNYQMQLSLRYSF